MPQPGMVVSFKARRRNAHAGIDEKMSERTCELRSQPATMFVVNLQYLDFAPNCSWLGGPAIACRGPARTSQGLLSKAELPAYLKNTRR